MNYSISADDIASISISHEMVICFLLLRFSRMFIHHSCLLDASKTFDRVKHNLLLHGTSYSLVYFQSQTFTVHWNSMLSFWFESQMVSGKEELSHQLFSLYQLWHWLYWLPFCWCSRVCCFIDSISCSETFAELFVRLDTADTFSTEV